MRINADDDASIDVYTKDGKTKLCTVNLFDFEDGRRGCVDVIPAAGIKANALVFRMDPAKPAIEMTSDGRPNCEPHRYRMNSNGLVCVELNA